MKRYRIIGKSKQMRSVFLRDIETGKFVQHRLIRGKTIDCTEEELTFHVERQQGYKILEVIELPDEIEEIPAVVEPEPEPEPVFIESEEEEVEDDSSEELPKPKRARSRRRKIEPEDGE